MYSSIYSVQSSTQRLLIRALFGFMLKQVESYPFPFSSESRMWWFVLGSPWVASLELKSKPSYLSIHTRSSSLIRQLYLDSRVKELRLHRFTFLDGQSLVLGPVAHLGLVVSSYLLPYVLYTSPGLCLVSVGRLPFKCGSKPQGD